MTVMQTHSGKKVDLSKVSAKDICSEDIAHSLAHICRFNGHTSEFHSVAQHSVHVSELMRDRGFSKKKQLYGLLHDAHEAYIGDMTSPLKMLFPMFGRLGDEIQKSIHEYYGLGDLNTAEKADIKEFDTISLLMEANTLTKDENGNLPHWAEIMWILHAMDEYTNPTIIPLSPKDAKQSFLDKLRELTK